MLGDYHIHTKFSDGGNTPEEVILSAISLGADEVGFSEHSFTEFDQSYCMKKDRLGEYIATIHSLREKYKDKIKVLCGIELDYYSEIDTSALDYVIGSAHYFKIGNDYFDVDRSGSLLKRKAEQYFNGDMLRLAELYFDMAGDMYNKTKCDIVGHFDLITKFNEDGSLIDEKNPRYIKAATDAADKLLAAGVTFEINYGAITRGYRTTPYPSKPLYEYIKANGGKFVHTSDSHTADNIFCFIKK